MISSRRAFSESLIELEVQVRCQNSSNEFASFWRSVCGTSVLRCSNVFELKKPGIDSKKFFSESSSPRVLTAQSKIRMSISDDRSDAVSSAALSTLPNIQ